MPIISSRGMEVCTKDAFSFSRFNGCRSRRKTYSDTDYLTGTHAAREQDEKRHVALLNAFTWEKQYFLSPATKLELESSL